MKTNELTMKLDELLSMPPRDDLPTAGGDYDTAVGWAARIGVGKDAAKRAIQTLTDRGLAEKRTGQIVCSSGYRKSELIYSPTLAKMIAER